jgi:hypothetical protein
MSKNKIEVLDIFKESEGESTRLNFLLDVTFILFPRRSLLSLLVRLKESFNLR